jgi:hypothetical protein
MAFLQKDHLLSIDTILNDDANEKKFQSDPLLLVKLDGVEAISRLYAYDVIMLRDAGDEKVNGQTRQPIDTTKLIGTHAIIGARPSKHETQTDDTIPFKRVGMFETFEDLLNIDVTKLLILSERDFHIAVEWCPGSKYSAAIFAIVSSKRRQSSKLLRQSRRKLRKFFPIF